MTVEGLRNPVAVGKELTYLIRVTNKGSMPFQQVTVRATVPEGMVFDPMGTVGPDGTTFSHQGQAASFTPPLDVPAGSSLVYRVHVLTKQVGKYTFHAELTAAGMAQPISMEANTDVFQP